MIFIMPDRDAKLPLWDDEELERNIQAYADRYKSEIDNPLEWVREELASMDFTMQAFSVMGGIPVETWDVFHDRWREVYLLQIHLLASDLVIDPSLISEKDFATYMAARLKDFFCEDTGWLQERPNNT